MITHRLTRLALGALLAVVTRVDGQAHVAQQPGVNFNERVIEITAPVIGGFMNGLDVEITLLAEFAQELVTYRAPGDYRRCHGRVASSPEFQKIQAQPATWPDNATPEELQRLSDKMAADMVAYVRKQCGGDILNEWPEHKRRERIEEIQRKAAVAAGPVMAAPGPRPRGPKALDEVVDYWMEQGAGLSVEAYLIMKERVEAYCKALNDGVIKAGEAVKFPGTGKDIYWVYTEEEAKAIAPLCVKALPKGQVTIKLGEAVVVPGKKLTLEMIEVIVQPSGIKLKR